MQLKLAPACDDTCLRALGKIDGEALVGGPRASRMIDTAPPAEMSVVAGTTCQRDLLSPGIWIIARGNKNRWGFVTTIDF